MQRNDYVNGFVARVARRRGGATRGGLASLRAGAVLVCGILAAAGCGREGGASGGGAVEAASRTVLDPAAVARGKESYMTTCIACHGPAGEGVPNLGKDLVHSEFVAGLSDTELVDFIKQGRSATDPLNTTGIAMLPKGGNPALNDDQIGDIVAFMRSIHADN